MDTRTALTDEDMNALVGLADMWGHALWNAGFFAPLDLDDDDHEAVGESQLSRNAEIIHRRDRTKLRLAELAEDGKIPAETLATVTAGLQAWADHRYDLGEVSRHSRTEGTPELGAWQLAEEDKSQELRYAWVDPLVALLDRDASQ